MREQVMGEPVKIAEDLREAYRDCSDPYVEPETLAWAIMRDKNMQSFSRNLIERVSAAEAALALAKEELERKGGAVFKMYVWRGRPDWIVMCHARTVQEARGLASEDSKGDGDWSTPVRLRMMKAMRESNPEIHYRECGETVLTATGETEELELYAKTKDDEISALKAELARLKAPVSDISRMNCPACHSEMDSIGFSVLGDKRLLFHCPKCSHWAQGATRAEWDRFLKNEADAAIIEARSKAPDGAQEAEGARDE